MTFQKNKRLFPPFYQSNDAVIAVKELNSFSEKTHNINKGIPLHFVQVGNPNASIAILFIHGSPGSWEGWAEYLHHSDLRKDMLLVAVDRPGYGGSDNNISGTSLKDQATAIYAALKDSFPDNKKWIIIGHSYGGPLAARFTIDYNESVDSLLLLAPAISPELVRVRFYNKLARIKFIDKLLTTPLRRSNDEMFLLSNELSIMKPMLKNIKIPVKVIQGEKDGIVHPGNAAFIIKNFTQADVQVDMLPQRGHFLPWEEFELIKNKLLTAIHNTK